VTLMVVSLLLANLRLLAWSLINTEKVSRSQNRQKFNAFDKKRCGIGSKYLYFQWE
jgi:hypothetical protein